MSNISEKDGLVLMREDGHPIAIVRSFDQLETAISDEYCGAKVTDIQKKFNKHSMEWTITAHIQEENEDEGCYHDFTGVEAVVYDDKSKDTKVYRLSHDHRHGTSVYMFESNKDLSGNYWEYTHSDELEMIAPIIQALDIDLELEKGETIDIEEVVATDATIII